jgi:hypothetical protein
MSEPEATESNVVQLVRPKLTRHRKITIRLAAQIADLPAALAVLGAMLNDQQIADISLFLTILPS